MSKIQCRNFVFIMGLKAEESGRSSLNESIEFIEQVYFRMAQAYSQTVTHCSERRSVILRTYQLVAEHIPNTLQSLSPLALPLNRQPLSAEFRKYQALKPKNNIKVTRNGLRCSRQDSFADHRPSCAAIFACASQYSAAWKTNLAMTLTSVQHWQP